MKKLHDVLFEEYKRIYVDEEPHTLLTGDEEADKSAFFEKGKLSTFFSFNLSLCFDVHCKLLDFAKNISEKSEKKVVVFTTEPLAVFTKNALETETEIMIKKEPTDQERVRLVEAMKGYKGRNLYIENACLSIEEIIRYLDGREDIEAAFIAKYDRFCNALPEENMARAKEDMNNFRILANCAERNDISIFLQTEYDDLYTYGTCVHANFEISGELVSNPLINIVICDFADESGADKLKFTRSFTDPHYADYTFRVYNDGSDDLPF